MLNKGLGIREMSNGTSESAGEKAIGLDQDKRKTVRREGQTNEPQSKSGVDQPHPHPRPYKGLRQRMNPILPPLQPDRTNLLKHVFICSRLCLQKDI